MDYLERDYFPEVPINIERKPSLTSNQGNENKTTMIVNFKRFGAI